MYTRNCDLRYSHVKTWKWLEKSQFAWEQISWCRVTSHVFHWALSHTHSPDLKIPRDCKEFMWDPLFFQKVTPVESSPRTSFPAIIFLNIFCSALNLEHLEINEELSLTASSKKHSWKHDCVTANLVGAWRSWSERGKKRLLCRVKEK